MPLEKPASEASLVELDALLKDHFELKKFAEAEPKPPEPEPEPVKETPPPEPEKPPSPKTEEPKQEPTEAAHENLDLDILRVRLEETEARLAKQEKLAGRQAGEIGFKQQQKIRDLEAEVERLQAKVSSGEVLEPEPEARAKAPVRRLNDAATAYLVAMAVNNAGAAFFSSNPEAQGLVQDIGKYLMDSGQDTRAILELDDPVEAAKQTANMFDVAFQHVRMERARTKRSELETRRADQIKGLAEAKVKATLSGSGASTPAEATPKTGTKKTLAELESELKTLDEQHGRRM